MDTRSQSSSGGWNDPSMGYIQKAADAASSIEPIATPDLPNEAIEEIAQILASMFHYRHQVDIVHRFEVMKRLREEAVVLRKTIQDKGRAAVRLDDLFEHHSLHTVIYKSQVEAWLALRAQKPTYGKEPPERCPACDMPLVNSWTCLGCGLELESPYLRMQLRASSQSQIRHLPYHYALLSDTERRRLLFINCREGHRVGWEIDAEQWAVEAPMSALYLDKHRILLTDRQQNRVFEVGMFGELLWEFNTEESERHALFEPSRVTLFHRAQDEYFLIADTGNHRVLMVDRHHRIHWQYGMMGEAGADDGYLDSPTDLQMTSDGHVLIVDSGNNRVIEVNSDNGRIVWQAPEHLGLLQPVFAERLQNHHMIIVDAGNYRVLELNPQGELEEEVNYYNQNLDPRFRLDNPTQYIRRENQNILLGSAQRMMEIDLIHKHALWVAPLNDLNYEYQDEILHSLDPNEEFVALVEKQDAPPMEQLSLNRVLQRTQVFQNAPEEFLEVLTPYLTMHTYYPEEKIVKEGETGDAMYILRKGKVHVVRGEDTLLATLETGDIFGEMALVLSEPRSATVKASTTCEVYRLSKWAFETAIQAFPDVYHRIQELAQNRAAITRLKTGRHLSAAEASEVLQTLLDTQLERLQKIKSEYKHQAQSVIVFRPPWRLMYTKIEQHAIHAAIREGWHCFELHLHSRSGEKMTLDQVCPVILLLREQGELIKLHPSADAIRRDLLNDTLALTLITHHSREQILEDLGSMQGWAPTQIFEIDF